MHETSLSFLSQGVNYVSIVSLLKHGDRVSGGVLRGTRSKYVGDEMRIKERGIDACSNQVSLLEE